MVHQEVIKAYELAGFPYIRTPHDIAELKFENWVKQSGRSPHIIVNAIRRVKTPPNENGETEFITWSEKRVGYDHVGNEQSFTEDNVGKYVIPIFQNEWDQSTNTIRAVQVQSNKTIFYQPYDVKKIDELYEKSDKTSVKFYVQIGSNRWGISSFDDFRDGDFERLVQLGKSDRYYLEELPATSSSKRKSESKRTSGKNETSSATS